MAKLKSRKGKGQYATYLTLGRYAKNKAAKLKRHLASHPEDAQAASARVEGSPTRKPAGKSGYLAEKVFWYDGAGRKFLMPSFAPNVGVAK